MTRRDQRGQTFIELLTAVFVLALALVGALSLANSNARNQTMGTLRLQGSYLAREGFEIARGIRDTNWLSEMPPDQWDTGLYDSSGSDHCAIIPPGASSFQFAECKLDSGKPVIFDPLYQLYRAENGGYSQNSDPLLAQGEATNFFRKVRFDPICLAGEIETVKTDGACDPGQKIGVVVTSEVWWQQGPLKSNALVTERLMNWK